MDRVRVLKLENSGSGTEVNKRPQLLNFNEDYIAVKGISFENLENSFIDISSGISGTDIRFSDDVNGEILLSELVTPEVLTTTHEPTGIPQDDLTKCTISYDYSTRILTLTHNSDYSVWVNGTKFLQTSTIILDAHANTYGTYYYYFNSTGTLTLSNSVWNFNEHAPVAMVIFNPSATSSIKGFAIDERHGVVMDWATHQLLHNTYGTQYISGLSIADYTPNTDSVAATTYSLTTGVISDEDLITTISEQTDGSNYTLFFRNGASGNWDWITGSATPYNIASNNIVYNQWTGATWQLTQNTTNSTFLNHYAIAIPAVSSTFQNVVIIGQNIYTTQSAATSEDFRTMISRGNLPFAEFCILYQITSKYLSSYSNTTGKSVIVSVNTLRGSVTITGGTASNSHLTLTNLNAGQYLDGGHANMVVSKISSNTNPTTTDDIDNYKEGSIWLRQDTNQAWLCTDNTNSAAIWQPIGIQTFTMVSDAEAAKGVDYNLCYVTENDTWYRYESSGSSYTDDNRWVLSTGDGGNTRWLGIAGKYIVTNTNVFYGFGTLFTNTTGSGNVAIGDQTLYSSNADYNTAIGRRAGYYTTGGSNTYIGNSAGYNATSGTTNVALGYAAYNGAVGPTYATGSGIVAVGYQAGCLASTVSNSVFIGYRSGYNVSSSTGLLTLIGHQSGFGLTTGNSNTLIGANAGFSLTTEHYNTMVGTAAGLYATSANNVFIGYRAGYGVSGQSTGESNLAIGYQALYLFTIGTHNYAIGENSLYNVTTGTSNYSIGYRALYNITTQNFNLAIGYQSGFYSVPSSTNSYNLFIGHSAGQGTNGQATGNENLAIGHNALFSYTTAGNNLAIGKDSLYAVTTGGFNYAIGEQALASTTQGTYNLAIGNYALNSITTSSWSYAIGYRAGRYATGSYNFFMGYWAGYGTSGQTTGTYNYAIGYESLRSLTTGVSNYAIGIQALYNITSQSYNFAIGEYAGQYAIPSTTNSYNYFLGHMAGRGTNGQATGSYNFAIGTQALYSYTTGQYNYAIGSSALIAVTTGNYNMAIGDNAGASVKIGSDNVHIGYNSGYYNLAGEQYSIGTQALYGVAPVYEVVTITVNGATLSNYVGDYFVLHSGIYGYNTAPRRGYWFDTTGSDAMPSFSADNKIKITITGLSDTTAIATAISNAIATDTTYFTSSSTTNVVTVTHKLARESTLSTNNCSEISLVITTRGTGTNGESSNIAIGQNALRDNTNGMGNVAIGRSSIQFNKIGVYNTAIGYQSLCNNKFGHQNVAIGINTLYESVTASDNVAIGYLAGRYLVSQENIAIGTYALAGMNGVQSVAEVTTITVNSATLANYVGDWFRFYNGDTAGRSNYYTLDYWFDTTGSDSKPAGANGTIQSKVDISACTTAAQIAGKIRDAINEYIYTSSGRYLSATAPSNVVTVTHLLKMQHTDADGTNASELTFNVTTQGTGNSSYFSVAIGYQSMYCNTTGVQNTAVGRSSLYNNTTGYNNIAYGVQAGYNNTIGYGNSFIGVGSGYYFTTANYNIALGYTALQGVSEQSTGGYNIGIGYQAGYVVTTGTYNIIEGYQAGLALATANYGVYLGYQASYVATSGDYVVAIGYATLANNTGNGNIGIGRFALSTNTTSTGLVAMGYYAGVYSTGVNNTFVGHSSGWGVNGQSSGTDNTYLGYYSGYAYTSGSYNTLLGSKAGETITSGANNTLIGYNTDLGTATNSNSIVIGSGAVSTANNQTFIGNSSTTSAIIKGIYGNTNGSNSYVRVGSDGTLYEDNNPPSAGGINFYEDIFTASASQTQFTLTNSPAAEASTWVFIDAAYSATDQYSISTNVLTLGSGLSGGEKVVIKYVY